MTWETDLAKFADGPPAQVVNKSKTKYDNSLIWHTVVWILYLAMGCQYNIRRAVKEYQFFWEISQKGGGGVRKI